MSVKATFSARQAQVVRRILDDVDAISLAPDDYDTLQHALKRLERAMDKHRVPRTAP